MDDVYEIEEDLARLFDDRGWLGRLAGALAAQPSDVDDLRQDTALNVIQRVRRLGAPRSKKAFVKTALRNQATNQAASARHRRGRELEHVLQRADSVRATDEIAEELELREIVSSLVRELPRTERDVILLRFSEGLSGSEVAARLGVPAGTARWRQKSGIDALRRGLDRRFGGDRSLWMGSVIALAQGPRLTPAAGSPLALFAVSKVKIVAAALVLFLGSLTWLGLGGSPAPAAPEVPPLISRDAGLYEPSGPARLAEMDSDRVAIDQEHSGVQAAGAESAGTVAIETGFRLQVVDPDGVPLPGSTVTVRRGVKAARAMDIQVRHFDPLAEVAGRESRLAAKDSARKGQFLAATADGSGAVEVLLPNDALLAELAIEIVGSNLGHASLTLRPQRGSFEDLGQVALAPEAVIQAHAHDDAGEPFSAHRLDLKQVLSDDSRERIYIERDVSSDLATFRTIKPGRYALTANVGNASTRRVVQGPTIDVELGRTYELDFSVGTLPPRQELSVRVLNPDGSPAEADIVWWNLDSDLEGEPDGGLWTGSDGVASVYSPQFGGKAVRVTARDWTLRFLDAKTTVEPPYDPIELRLRPAPNKRAKLTILGPDGLADGSASVAIRSRRIARSIEPVDKERPGVFELLLPAGPDETFDLAISSDLARSLLVEEQVASLVPEEWTLRLERQPQLFGEVVSGGQPVPHALVSVAPVLPPGYWLNVDKGVTRSNWWVAKSVTADLDGRFAIPIEQAGDIAVLATAPAGGEGFIHLREDQVASTMKVPVTLEVQPLGRLSGVARGTGRLKIGSGWVAIAAHEFLAPRKVEIDDAGEFDFGDLPCGEWQVYCQSGDFHPGLQFYQREASSSFALKPNVRIEAGVQHRVVIGPAASVELEGRIILEGDLMEMPEGARVRVYADEEDLTGHRRLYGRVARVNADGSFSIDAFADLPQHLVFEEPGSGLSITVNDLQPSLDMEIRVPMAALELSSSGGYRYGELISRSPNAAVVSRANFELDGSPGTVRIHAVAGEYTLRLYQGTKELERDVTLQAGGVRVLQIN